MSAKLKISRHLSILSWLSEALGRAAVRESTLVCPAGHLPCGIESVQ